MDYGKPELADKLAAQYVLGTLRGPARARFEQLLPAHPALRQAVAQWQQRLAPLAHSVPEVQPSPRVWQNIEARLFSAGGVAGSASAASNALSPHPSWWRSLGLSLPLWRSLTGVATAAALALLLLGRPAPSLNDQPVAAAQAPIVIVLGATPEAAAALNASVSASFVASVSADGRALVLQPLQDLRLQPGRALELWAVPAQGAPRSLGLVQTSGATTLLRAQLLVDTAAFAVSVEPAGGSPAGAPTGPIVSVGKLQL